MMKKSIILGILCTSCISGPVTTDVKDHPAPVVETPTGFSSPLLAIEKTRPKVIDLLNGISKPNSKSTKWRQAISWLQEYENLSGTQEELESLLQKDGQIELEPGQSYSFDLDSFCVNAKQPRPFQGDGLQVSYLKGPSEKWLPDILEKYPSLGIPQNQVQQLIWALLSGARFDELSSESQQVLTKIFPDAPIRFGNRIVEGRGWDFFSGLLPSEKKSAIDTIKELHDQFLEFQGDFRHLEQIFAPRSNREKPIPVGWLKMQEGYFLKLMSTSYQEIHVDIYVPPKSDRSPQGLSSIFFVPWKLIGLPAVGQRLAIAPKARLRPKPDTTRICKDLSRFRPQNCPTMTDEIRTKILALADPSHFPKTRYASPPLKGLPIEQETDCSSFMHEIYRRAGIDYPYVSTSLFSCLKVFNETNDKNAKPGDLILYNGHAGLLDSSGKVISATRGGPDRRSMKNPNDKDFLSSITDLEKTQAHSGPWKIFRWSCP